MRARARPVGGSSRMSMTTLEPWPERKSAMREYRARARLSRVSRTWQQQGISLLDDEFRFRRLRDLRDVTFGHARGRRVVTMPRARQVRGSIRLVAGSRRLVDLSERFTGRLGLQGAGIGRSGAFPMTWT